MRISDGSSDVCSSDLSGSSSARSMPRRSAVFFAQCIFTSLLSWNGTSRIHFLRGVLSRSLDTSLAPAMSFLRSVVILDFCRSARIRSEEHTSELKSLMRISYAVICLNKKIQAKINRQQEL